MNQLYELQQYQMINIANFENAKMSIPVAQIYRNMTSSIQKYEMCDNQMDINYHIDHYNIFEHHQQLITLRSD